MKAIILNSGIGKRMRPFTNDNPKCLAKLNGKTILEHEIENLIYCGINEMIITTGPFEDKIKEVMEKKFPDVKVTYVKNTKYKSTNYIYSMWLIKDMIDDDIILLHGDMVFDKVLLSTLIKSKCLNCALVNNKIKPPEKDFKANVVNGYIKKIGVNVFGKNCFFLAPIYKFSKSDFMKWLKEIGKFIDRNNIKVYAEDAFNEISDKVLLKAVYYDNKLCMEVDNFDDLNKAKQFF